MELEKRADVAMKGVNVLLFKESIVSAKEKRILQQRLRDYTSGKRFQVCGAERPSESICTEK
ncbi:MAG: hypothetical protein ACYCQJ_10910 [Nitrososphaerales archaeon]